MIPRSREEPTTTAQKFFDQYEVTPRFFVGRCLLPALSAVTRLSCFYHGELVETLEIPAWKTRLRAWRTVLAMTDAEDIEQKRIKIPLGALGPAQLATIADAFLERDWYRITPDFLAQCLKAALDAVNIAYVFYHGRLVDSRQITDWDLKLEALKIVSRVKKLYADECDNIHFATYRDITLLVSEAHRMSRTIDLVRRTQLVYVR